MHTQLLHLSGPLRGRTVTHEDPHLLVGTDPDAAVRFPAGTPSVKPRHAEFAFREEECAIHLRPIEGQVFVNGQEIKSFPIQLGERTMDGECELVDGNVDLERLGKHFRKGINRFEVEVGGDRAEIVLDVEL